MRLAVLLLVALPALAGCSGGGGGDEAEEPALEELGLEATATTGLIRGVVVDSAIRPLADVSVQLVEPAREATTTAGGAFGFDGLPAGTYFLRFGKLGYLPAQASADVVAGVAEPPAVKVQLAVDAAFRPFGEAFVYEGFIECTTSFLVLCGAPNTVEPFFCGGFDPLPPVCYGNVTNDRFTFTQFFQDNLTMLQSEMVWESNQAASPDLTLSQEALTADCPNTDLTTLLNGTSGASPLYTRLHRDILKEYEIGPACGVYYSVFAGDAIGDPTGQGVAVGATIEQRFTIFMHAFYGYLPPDDWRFSTDSTVPPPQ